MTFTPTPDSSFPPEDEFDFFLDENGNILVPVGKRFRINLPNNYTTGYEWRIVELEDNLVALVRAFYEPDEPITVGSGGTQGWIFKAVHSGSTKLIFGHYPPGLEEPVAYQSFMVIIK